MRNKSRQTSQRTNKLRGDMIKGMNMVSDKGCVYLIALIECYNGYRYFQLKNKMCLWNTNAPETPIFWETWSWYLTLTFPDDLDKVVFINEMCLYTKYEPCN